MKKLELKELIKEEIKKVLKESPKFWDSKTIEDFFKFLTTLNIEGTYDFTNKKGTNGEVEIKAGRGYEAEFGISNKEYLVFRSTPNSNIAAEDFVNFLNKNGVGKKYDFFHHGNLAMITIK